MYTRLAVTQTLRLLTTHTNHIHTRSPIPLTPIYPSVLKGREVESQDQPAIDQTHNRYVSDLQQQREEIDMEMEAEITPSL